MKQTSQIRRESVWVKNTFENPTSEYPPEWLANPDNNPVRQRWIDWLHKYNYINIFQDAEAPH